MVIVGLFIILSGQIFAQNDSTKTPYDLYLEASGYTGKQSTTVEKTMEDISAILLKSYVKLYVQKQPISMEKGVTE
ncbi:MAG: hypothetical protein KAG99_05640 [Bacteroidales bacterium]|nr:hypothetical protein [Bacteroidales bacterium]